MDEAKLNLLIKKSVVPKASVTSLIMCVTSVGRTDQKAACRFMAALCDQDISKAALVTKQLAGALKNHCRAVVHDTLRQHIRSADTFSVMDLLAILEYEDQDLFRESIPVLSNYLIRQAMLRATSQGACRLMQMILQYADGMLIDSCLQEFTAFLNRYDSSGDNSLARLLPILLDYNAVALLSKLIEILGIPRLEALYGGGLREELDRMIVSGFDSPELWDAYFFFFFQTGHSMEELLTGGLWYIQLYAGKENENIAAACFYLYAAEYLGVDHPIFDLTVCFERPSQFSRRHTARYQEEAQRHWESPGLLARFLEKTEICNPFEGDVLQKNSLPLLRDIHNFRDYSRLASLFEKNTSCETILKVFCGTDLKYNLPMEDLLYLCRRYGVLEEMLEQLAGIEFSGLAMKHNLGEVVLAPKSYHVMSLHVMQLEYHFLEDRQNVIKNWKGKKLTYTITGFENGQIMIKGFRQETSAPELACQQETWETAMESLEGYLVSGNEQGFLASKKCTIYKYSVDSFLGENDFGLLTELYSRFPERIDSLLLLLSRAKWNAAFIQADVVFPPKFFSDFGRYQDQSVRMFQAMLATPDIPYTKILQLYFSSIYRVIVPLDRLLERADREVMLQALAGRTVYMRLYKKDQTLCRPLNLACSPVCRVENAGELESAQKFPAIITDYTMVGGVVSRIILSSQLVSHLNLEERGSLFGYLAMNEHISKKRLSDIERLPDFDLTNSRELLFNLTCMEDAILLRKSSGALLMQLIHVLGTKNPFAFQRNIQIDVCYLGRLYADKRKKKITDAMVSIILNTPDIGAIGEIYRNTLVRHYLNIEELARLIAGRRPDLVDRLPQMFPNVQFQCTADRDGWLWSPFVAQSSVLVGSGYAGMELMCSLCAGADGTVTAQVLSARERGDVLHPMILCLMKDYQISDAITPYLSACLVEQGILEDDKEKLQTILQDLPAFRSMMVQIIGRQKSARMFDEEKSEFLQQVQALYRMLENEEYNHPTFVKQTTAMIRQFYRDISRQSMEQALAELSKRLMQRSQDTGQVFQFLRKVFSDYSYGYRDNGLVTIWLSQLAEYLGSDAAARFDTEIRKNPKFFRNQSFS